MQVILVDTITTGNAKSEAGTNAQKYRARIEVRAARGLLEPESETIRKALIDLGFQVPSVKVGKVYEVTLEANSKKDAESTAKTICSRLLVNPTKDDYTLEVEPVGSNSSAASKP